MITLAGEESQATFTLDTFGVPYTSVSVPQSGLFNAALERVPGSVGNYNMVIMTSGLQCMLLHLKT
jgi:hypothetical protein